MKETKAELVEKAALYIERLKSMSLRNDEKIFDGFPVHDIRKVLSKMHISRQANTDYILIRKHYKSKAYVLCRIYLGTHTMQMYPCIHPGQLRLRGMFGLFLASGNIAEALNILRQVYMTAYGDPEKMKRLHAAEIGYSSCRMYGAFK